MALLASVRVIGVLGRVRAALGRGDRRDRMGRPPDLCLAEGQVIVTGITE